MPAENPPLAVAMMPMETRRDAILHLASRADEIGYEALFLPETWSHDTTVLLAEIAGCTKQIRLGTGVLGIWGRSSATIAMASSTLDTLSNGRFILGLGSSTRQLAEGLHDVPFGDPYERLRGVVTQVRALLQGERIPLAATEARALRLNVAPHPDLPIYLAASSSKSIRIAGELCDGWIPFLFPRDHLADGLALLREGVGLADAGRPETQVCPIIPTVVAEDTARARQGAAWVVAFYLTKMGPIYRAALSRYGYASEVEAVLQASADSDSETVPAEAEALLEQLTVYGTPEDVPEQVARWYGAGASMPVLMMNPNLGRDETDFMLRALRRAR
jgi:alkanesulfonate monooxygenase SsuD/methylene tetrahydromethanopterin reductase-like flavin-dependent oxidoreductase (luciferase family)